jgi:dGTPase
VTKVREAPGDARGRCENGAVSRTAAVESEFEARQRAWEDAFLSPLAQRSYPAERARPEADCGLRTPFQRDRDRIVHSKAFRRLKHKTQVFVAPEGDHFRTRLTHTLEATQISRTVARALRFNEDLVEAIGLGHDVGHPPFGHIGEDVLDRCGRERFGRGFRHNEQSLRVVETLEALNLTAPVRDGILRHSSGAGEPATLEGKIVRLVDRIAYINHDIDDALRAGVLSIGDLPADEIAVLGDSGSARIDTLVHDLVEHSSRAGDIAQGPVVGPAMLRLRTFMFERVYLGPTARAEHAKIERVLRGLFDWYCEHPDELPPGESPADRVIDWLAGMTDRFAIRAWTERFVPQGLPA